MEQNNFGQVALLLILDENHIAVLSIKVQLDNVATLQIM